LLYAQTVPPDRMNAIYAITQFLAFDAAWFAAVAGGAAGWPWTGSLPALLVVALHLAVTRQTAWQELKLVAAITVFGVLLETGLMAAGVISYVGAAPGQILPPVWIWALWVGFATLPNASLRWMQGRWKLQALFGLLFGPLAYWTGAKMGAASFPGATGTALVAIALVWALAFPTIMLLAERIAPQKP
jgi:hypothetical protein